MAPRSAECAPVHMGEVVAGDRAGRRAVPRSLRRFEIGDCLYGLFEDYDGQIPDEVLMYPVVRITRCYAFVNGYGPFGADEVYQFSRAVLEREGYAFHRRLNRALYTRPKLEWPPLVVSVSGPRGLEAGVISAGLNPKER